MDQFLTLKRANIGPVFNFTAYTYTHISFWLPEGDPKLLPGWPSNRLPDKNSRGLIFGDYQNFGTHYQNISRRVYFGNIYGGGCIVDCSFLCSHHRPSFLKFPNAVVLNAVGHRCKWAQNSTGASPQKSAKGRKKGAKERKEHFRIKIANQRRNKGGGKTQGRGKHTIKPLPKNDFGPPTYDTFPPPFFTQCHFLRGNGHRPHQSHFLSPPNWFWRAHSMVRFPPPPQKSHDTFCPPISRFPKQTARFETTSFGNSQSQRRWNDDKNNFWEVESKVGSAGGSKRGLRGDPSWNSIVGLKHRKNSIWKVAFILSSLFPRKCSDNNIGQLPSPPPSRGSD